MVILDIQRVVDQDAPSDSDFQCWADLALSDQKKPSEVVIRIVDELEIKQLNQTYRDQDKTTNVLSFPFEAPEYIDLPLLGDLVICAKVVIDEAKNQSKDLKAHWAHMIIHGILHLLGYDHIIDAEAEKMERKEQQLLAQLDFPNPYRNE